MTITDIDTTLIADLQTARDYIAEHGLAKKCFSSGGACTVGALLQTMDVKTWQLDYPNFRLQRAIFALASTLGVADQRAIKSRVALYAYNDDPSTELADVIGLYETTIARLAA